MDEEIQLQVAELEELRIKDLETAYEEEDLMLIYKHCVE